MRRAPAPLLRALALLWALCVLALAMPASAQPPRVWIDRDRIAYDETVTLTMEVDLQSTAGMPNLVDLTRDFRIVDQRLEQDMGVVNGQIALKVRMQLVLAPTREGTIDIPSMWVGRDATAPLRVTVLPPLNPRVVDEPPPSPHRRHWPCRRPWRPTGHPICGPPRRRR